MRNRLKAWVLKTFFPEMALLQAELDQTQAARYVERKAYATANDRIRELSAQNAELYAKQQQYFNDNKRMASQLRDLRAPSEEKLKAKGPERPKMRP